MSELAAGYYQERARRLVIDPIPNLLNGHPVLLLSADERPVPKHLPAAFGQEVETVESFVLDGVLGVQLASGNRLTVPEWHAIRALPGFRARSAAKYAAGLVVPHMLSLFPLRGGEVFVEAIARSEVPERALLRATVNTYAARGPLYEDAEVFLLTRTMGEDRQTCYSAHFTLVWGDYLNGEHRSNSNSYLTARYLGNGLLPQELAVLPPLLQ